MSIVSRRTALAGAALAPLAGIRPAAATAAAMPSAVLDELHRLVARAKATWVLATDLDGQPGGAEAEAEAAALDAEIADRAAAIWATPVTTWADVVARAAIADNWAPYDDRGELWDINNAEYIGERAAAELLKAVLDLGRHRNV
jgi:hypothetical protein